jgi:hypothetical protein
MYSVLCSMLFYFSMSWYIFYVTVLFSVLLHAFSVLLYSSVLLCCLLLFILPCSSSYVCVLVCIYSTLTLPPGVNPITVNKYLSSYLIEARSRCLFGGTMGNHETPRYSRCPGRGSNR